MRLLRTIKERMILVILLGGVATVWLTPIFGNGIARASQASLQEQGDGLMKNVEEMLAHGGMGDAKAIVHHCGEATGYAETLIKQLSVADSHAKAARTALDEVIRQCRRVSEIGIHADPGLLLNPAIKARAAARDSIKALGLSKSRKG